MELCVSRRVGGLEGRGGDGVRRDWVSRRVGGLEDHQPDQPEKYYREGHLPGAIRMPHDEVRQRAGAVLPNKDDFIVVYCANTACQNSRSCGQEAPSFRGGRNGRLPKGD